MFKCQLLIVWFWVSTLVKFIPRISHYIINEMHSVHQALKIAPCWYKNWRVKVNFVQPFSDLLPTSIIDNTSIYMFKMTTQFSNEQHALYKLNIVYMLAKFYFLHILWSGKATAEEVFIFVVAISLLTSHETYTLSMCLSNEGRKACILACRVSELEAALQKWSLF